MNPAQREAEANNAVAAVRAALSAAKTRVALIPDPDPAVVKNLGTLQEQVEKWATTYRKWATAGLRDDGSAYSWDRWSKHGLELGEAAAYHAKEGWNSSSLKVLADTAGATLETVATATKIGAPIALLALLVAGLVYLSLFVRNR